MNIDKPKIGVLLPTRGLLLGGEQPANADRILRMAERVEAAGLDSVWVGDSLVAKPRLEPLAALGAIAARTSRVRLGTAVLLPALRHPVLLAQTMATVDLISGGRLIIGAGVGGAFNDEQRGEWKAAGVDPTRRARRFEEIVEVVKGLGPGEPYDFKGRHFDFDAVTMRPSTTQPGGIPVLMATHYRAGRPAQIDRAARLSDGIIAISDTPGEFSQVIAQVEAKAAELGRDPAHFNETFYLTVNVDSDLDRGPERRRRFSYCLLRGRNLGYAVGPVRRDGEGSGADGGVRRRRGPNPGGQTGDIRSGTTTGRLPGKSRPPLYVTPAARSGRTTRRRFASHRPFGPERNRLRCGQ